MGAWVNLILFPWFTKVGGSIAFIIPWKCFEKCKLEGGVVIIIDLSFLCVWLWLPRGNISKLREYLRFVFSLKICSYRVVSYVNIFVYLAKNPSSYLLLGETNGCCACRKKCFTWEENNEIRTCGDENGRKESSGCNEVVKSWAGSEESYRSSAMATTTTNSCRFSQVLEWFLSSNLEIKSFPRLNNVNLNRYFSYRFNFQLKSRFTSQYFYWILLL